MKQRVQVARAVFPETLDYLARHFNVAANQDDKTFSPEELASLPADKDGALSVRIDPALRACCPKFKPVYNIAVGYNNIDLDAGRVARVALT